MQKKTVVVLLFILTGIFLVGCVGGRNAPSAWDVNPQEKPYLVYGRVQNFAYQAIDNCKVVLIKREATKSNFASTLFSASDHEDYKVMGEYLVAVTSKSGDYSFQFEPNDAFDLWLYFEAPGYKAQNIRLNSYLTAMTMLSRQKGVSPISVDVILEPQQN